MKRNEEREASAGQDLQRSEGGNETRLQRRGRDDSGRKERNTDQGRASASFCMMAAVLERSGSSGFSQGVGFICASSWVRHEVQLYQSEYFHTELIAILSQTAS